MVSITISNENKLSINRLIGTIFGKKYSQFLIAIFRLYIKYHAKFFARKSFGVKWISSIICNERFRFSKANINNYQDYSLQGLYTNK